MSFPEGLEHISIPATLYLSRFRVRRIGPNLTRRFNAKSISRNRTLDLFLVSTLEKQPKAQDTNTPLGESKLSDSNHERIGEFYPFFLQLLPERIVELKAILEGYDELGVLRTLNRKTGVVVILAISDLRPTLEALIDSLLGQLEMVRIPRPDGVSEDWLVEAIADE